MPTLTHDPATHLDFLLAEVCRSLQLTQTAYESAEEKYLAVCRWLGAEGSALQVYRPSIYPQGSAAIGTTVRPYKFVEHDVDLVLLLDADGQGPMELYELAWDRMAENGVYRPKLVRKNRCIRLEYAGDFHLDILPAITDPGRPGNAILVPDRDRRSWSPSNPRDYRSWFLERARHVSAVARREAEPLPPPEDSDQKEPLKRVVQLLKRGRDVHFDGDENAVARSIVLTTLAAGAYGGDASVSGALRRVISSIGAALESSNGIPAVPNPTRPEENFAESWETASFALFKGFIGSMKRDLQELGNLRGAEAIRAKLEDMFGEEPTGTAFMSYGELLRTRREAGNLSVGTAGLVTGTAPGAVRVPKHEFYGDGA